MFARDTEIIIIGDKLFMTEKTEKQVKARNERRRFKVDYTTIDELAKMPFVIRVEREPEIKVYVWTERSPEYPVCARFGEVIVQQQYLECPWIWQYSDADGFAKVFNETDRREGGSDDTHKD